MAEDAISPYPDVDEQPYYAWAAQGTADRHTDQPMHDDSPADDSDLEADEITALIPAINQGSVGESSYNRGYQFSDDGFISSEDESSDEDKEFYTLESDVVDFQQKLKQRRGANRESTDDAGRSIYGNRGGRRGPRGPRKPLEPSLEIKMLLSQANAAFVAGEYDTAEALANRIILMNDETYTAHALLSGIYFEQGDTRLGIIANLSAAHLRPRDPSLWRSCAHLILEHGRENRAEYLKDAIYCFSQLIRINPKDFESRYERALLVRELGLHGRAAKELYQIHEMLPRDTNVLRLLAEIYIDTKEIEKAKQLYQQYITEELNGDADSPPMIGWSDINVFIELFSYQEEYSEGIMQLRALSRCLLGREDETFWDDFLDDDREWDADDYPRRISVDGFVPNRHERIAYGEGLPLELRVKLGIFRLNSNRRDLTEPLSHFSWLDPEDDQAGAKLFDYPDLFREAADALQEAGNQHEALKFYEPLQQVEDYPDTQLYFNMALSYKGLRLTDKAEQCYKTVLENDEKNIDARAQLARLYEELGMSEEAFAYANEVLLLTQQEAEERGQVTTHIVSGALMQADTTRRRPSTSRPRVLRKNQPSLTAQEQAEREIALNDAMRMQYVKMQATQDSMRDEHEEATLEWMKAAQVLVQEFRSAKVFYPWDKYVRFLGYTTDARKRATKSKQGDVLRDMEAMADRMKATIEQRTTDDAAESSIPMDYRGIAFDEWLDVFLEYALCLAKRGDSEEAYDILNAAQDANVFHHSPERVSLINICWSACALILNDEETVCNVARWFMKEYQFTTDVYRLYAALNRVCQTPTSWYNSGPSQKFILRQVKAMDYSLVSEEFRSKHYAERGSYTAKGLDGEPFINDEMDVALLMLYGHVLYAGTSYSNAFNYFYRAYDLDPDNPMVNLFIGLAYLHHSLKRQSENRHYLIMQGYTFLYQYYDIRRKSSLVQEQQEAEYNLARSFHMLGLTHLALPYYEKTLELSVQHQPSSSEPDRENFTREAAYNLQNLYVTTGNLEKARQVTERHLVI